jgi:hypothetical protein
VDLDLPRSRRRRTGLLLSILGSVAICALTLFPTAGQPDTPVFCVFCGERSLLDAVLNIGLFVPLGVGLALLGVGTMRAALGGLVLSLTVELLQATVVPGRDPALRDVLTNMLGAVTGAAIGHNLTILRAPSLRTARLLVSTTGSVWIALHALGDWAAQPAFDASYIFPAPPIATEIHQRFSGRLLETTFNGRAIRRFEERLTSTELAPSQGRTGMVRTTATVVPDARGTSRIAPILMLAKPPEDIQLVLGQLGSSLIFRVRSRADDLRLRPLVFQMDRAFPGRSGAIGTPGAPLSLVTDLRPGRIYMSAKAGDRERVQVGRIGPALVWVHILPFELPVGPLTSTGALVWLVASLIPIGYWCARAGMSPRTGRGFVAVLGVLVVLGGITLVLLPAALGVARGTVWEWVAAGCGVFGGAAAGARRERERTLPLEKAGAVPGRA